MVEGVRLVSEKLVVVRLVAIWVAADGTKPAVVLRKTLYVTPELTLAVQLRLTALDEPVAEVRAVGADGMAGPPV
jgi:hypothetical protein